LLTSLLVGMAMLGTFLFLTYFLQGTLGYSALKTGFAFLPFSAGIIIGAGSASRILPRTGPRTLIVTGLAMATVALMWFSRLQPHSTYALHVLVPEVIMSIGMGLVFVPMNSTSLYGVDPEDAGVASALVNTTQQVGGALGTAFLNTIAASATASYLVSRIGASKAVKQVAAVHGYTTAFEVSAALVAASLVVAAIFIGPKSNHVLAGEGADPMALEREPAFSA
jgi:predicted MFS family arabinose efflux permease